MSDHRSITEVEASWEWDACECGQTFKISEGHSCDVRTRLGRRKLLTNTPFVVKPVKSVQDEEAGIRRPATQRVPKRVPRRERGSRRRSQ